MNEGRDEGTPAGTIEGAASYRIDEAEFAASERATALATGRVPDSRIIRIALAFLGSTLLLIGLPAVLLWLGSAGFRRQEKADEAAVAGLVLAAFGGWFTDRWLFAPGRRMRRRFRESPLAGQRFDITLTPDRLLSRTSKSEVRMAWDFFPGVVELRDGFVLVYPSMSGLWVPKRGIVAPFNARGVAGFLRSKARTYRVINRRAGSAE